MDTQLNVKPTQALRACPLQRDSAYRVLPACYPPPTRGTGLLRAVPAGNRPVTACYPPVTRRGRAVAACYTLSRRVTGQ